MEDEEERELREEAERHAEVTGVPDFIPVRVVQVVMGSLTSRIQYSCRGLESWANVNSHGRAVV